MKEHIKLAMCEYFVNNGITKEKLLATIREGEDIKIPHVKTASADVLTAMSNVGGLAYDLLAKQVPMYSLGTGLAGGALVYLASHPQQLRDLLQEKRMKKIDDRLEMARRYSNYD